MASPRVQRTDFAYDPLMLPVKTGVGTMRVEGYFTSSGVYSYPQEDGTILREWRPPNEVEDATSLDSLRMVPVTIGHPGESVTLDNIKDLAVGSLGDSIRTETEWGIGPKGEGRRVKVRGTAVLTDAAAIAIVEAKELPEVSCGYMADLEMTPGVTPEGEVYDAIQRRLVYNHLAIGVVGRLGPGIALRVDSKNKVPTPVSSKANTTENTMKKIRIDGVDFEGSEQLAQAVEKMGERQASAVATEKARADSLEAEKAALQKTLGETEARADAAAAAQKESEKRAAELNAKVKEGVKARKTLEKTAEKIMGAEAFKAAGIEDVDDENEIKAAVVKAANPARDLTEKVTLAKTGDVGAMAYISAAFDIVVEGAPVEAHADSADVSKDAGTLKSRTGRGDSATPDADKARAEAIERKNNAWKPKA